MNSWRTFLANLLIALFVVGLWSVSFVATRHMVINGFPPYTIALLRFIMAYLLLLPLIKRNHKKPLLRDQFLFAASGIFGISLYFVFENVSLKFTQASNIALIIASIPIFTALISWIFRLEPMRLTSGIGLLLGFSGIYVLLFGFSGEFIAVNKGDILVFGAVGSWVVYTFVTQQLVHRYPSGRITLESSFWGIVFLLFFSVTEASQWQQIHWNSQVIISLLYLGIFCSALAYILWARAIRNIGVTVSSNLLYLMPIMTVVGERIFLHEKPSPNFKYALPLILLGVFLASMKWERKKDVTPPLAK